MYKFVLLVLALVAVAAAQYLPYAYNSGLYRSGVYGAGYASPLAYNSGLGFRSYGAYGAGAYGAYPYLG